MNLPNLQPAVASVTKSPIALAVAVALGLGVLYLSTRGSAATATPAGNADAVNVALADQTTQYNIAALGYQGKLSDNAVATHGTDVNAATALALQTLASSDNAAALQASLEAHQVDQAVAINMNAANNAALLNGAALQAVAGYRMAQLQSTKEILLAPSQVALSENLAATSANQAIATANIAASSAAQIAALHNAGAVQTAQVQAQSQSDAGLIGSLPGLISTIGDIFSF